MKRTKLLGLPLAPTVAGISSLSRSLTSALLSLAFVISPAASSAAETRSTDKLKKLSLAELVDVEISTVSKRPEPWSRAASAITVISGEEIRRAGIRSVAEALRLAPGTHVATIDGNKWATGIRGFSSRLSRSILVLIDGRSVYTPLFAGVYWQAQDTFLEDIDRIEIIRGPGGTLWGANAVNGVVNIITKSATETEGSYATIGGGTEQRAFGGARYGAKVGEAGSYRVYAKAFRRDELHRDDDIEYDSWDQGQVGFRSDWKTAGEGTVTVQGDYYDGKVGDRIGIVTYEDPTFTIDEGDTDLAGGNVLARWTRPVGNSSRISLQSWYDRTERRQTNFREWRDTVDLEFQQTFDPMGRHGLVWGLGYRYTQDETKGVETVAFIPEGQAKSLVSGFVQDSVELLPEQLRATLGIKLEHNDYTGFEYQPSARLLWTPDDRHTAWTAVSRSVRTPSRLEHDLEITGAQDPASGTHARLIGSREFVSETTIAYEAGWRFQPVERLFVDVAAFYNDYHDLTSIEARAAFTESAAGGDRTIQPFALANGIEGEGYGAELSVVATPHDRLRVYATYSYLELHLQTDGVSLDSTGPVEGGSPRNQASLRLQADLTPTVTADAMLRYVDSLPALAVDAYAEADLRLAWQATPDIDIAVVGNNLLHDRHREFNEGSVGGAEPQRGVYIQLTVRK